MIKKKIILASGSEIRAAILRGAGVDFEIRRPHVDEAAIKRAAAREGLSLNDTAMRLADAKCMAVAEPLAGDPGALIIGSDQIMEFAGRPYDKPETMAEARARLLDMQGAAHTLINAVAMARGGRIIWRNLDRPRLELRAMRAAEIDAYLAAAGPEILTSVGAYQIEKLGGRLFSKVEGDHFAILGLSLFPLLDLLRQEGALDF